MHSNQVKKAVTRIISAWRASRKERQSAHLGDERNKARKSRMKVHPSFRREMEVSGLLLTFVSVQDLTVRRGSSATYRLESGAGNYRYTPLAKIRF